MTRPNRALPAGVAGLLLLNAGLLSAAVHPLVRPGTILIEGERHSSCTFVVDTIDPLLVSEENGVLRARRFEKMSGGAASLLSSVHAPDSAYAAVYEFVVRSAGPYHLWVFEQGRPWASPFEWRISDSPWRTAPSSLPTEHHVRLAKDGPSFLWCRLGALSLGAGKHRLEVRVSGARGDGRYLLAQDCFALVSPLQKDEGRPFEYAHEGPSANSVLLWDSLPPHAAAESGFLPWIDPYLLEGRQTRGAVLVFPGGAYVGRAPSEGANVARRFNKEGFHAFVVYYRTAPHHHPAQLMDAARAVRIVRSRATQYKVDPAHIAVCGFSAGGHLCASLGVHFDKAARDSGDVTDTVSARPDALVLCYPVISFGEYGHRGSMRNLLGDNPPDSLVALLSLEGQVRAETPPTFLWHTAPDDVKVENSLMFASALSARKVPFEIHVFHRGPHALNLAEKEPHVANWVKLCVEWLTEMGWKPAVAK